MVLFDVLPKEFAIYLKDAVYSLSSKSITDLENMLFNSDSTINGVPAYYNLKVNAINIDNEMLFFL